MIGLRGNGINERQVGHDKGLASMSLSSDWEMCEQRVISFVAFLFVNFGVVLS